MAFLSKVGNILRQTASRQIGSEISASRPSIYQGIRCMSSSKVFIGGISYQTDEAGLREAFDKYGSVLEAKIIVDRETGRSRGFGFVTYSSQEEASSAIQALDGQDLHGRRVRVNFATERPPRTYNNSYGNYGGGYGGGGYGTGGNYGGGGGGYGTGGGGYGSNDGNYQGGNVSSFGAGGGGGDGNYAGGSTYDNVPGNYGVAAGGGGNENYASTSSDGGFGYGGGDQFGANDNTALGGGLNQDDAPDSSFKDDDDSGDFAKRA